MLLPLSSATAALLPITMTKGEQLALVRTERSLQSPLKPMEKRISFLSRDFGSDSERPDGLESRVVGFFLFLCYFSISCL